MDSTLQSNSDSDDTPIGQPCSSSMPTSASNLVPMVLSAPESNNHYDDSDSGEGELGDHNPMPHLARCITLCGGNPEYKAWGA